MGRLLKSHFISALLGGLVVGGGLIVLGFAGPRRTQTIVEPSPAVSAPASAASVSGLTPHDIYQRDAPGVVFVRAKLVEQVESPFNLFHTRQSNTSTGSGFLVDRRGDVLTNYHLVDGADRSDGVTVAFEDGRVRAASVVAVDPPNDIAVLRADMRGLSTVRPLNLGDSTSVRVGDPTLTIGNPFGVDRTLTSGIVSALQHEIQVAGRPPIDNVIQTDQAIAAGNSGGPLLDANGRVIGINSQLATGAGPDGVSQRLTFAIPIDTADTVLARIAHQVKLHLAYLGVGAPASAQSRTEAVVGSVAQGSPAAEAGLRSGDVIQRVANTPVDSVSDVLAVISTRSPGQVISLQIRRRHRQQTVAVSLGSRTVPTRR